MFSRAILEEIARLTLDINESKKGNWKGCAEIELLWRENFIESRKFSSFYDILHSQRRVHHILDFDICFFAKRFSNFYGERTNGLVSRSPRENHSFVSIECLRDSREPQSDRSRSVRSRCVAIRLFGHVRPRLITVTFCHSRTSRQTMLISDTRLSGPPLWHAAYFRAQSISHIYDCPNVIRYLDKWCAGCARYDVSDILLRNTAGYRLNLVDTHVSGRWRASAGYISCALIAELQSFIITAHTAVLKFGIFFMIINRLSFINLD